MAVVKVEKNSYTVDPLYQWDLNQVLEIRGLSMPATPEVHFTNGAMVRAVRRFATMDAAGVIRVEVPNAILQKPHAIRALVCLREGEVFKTYKELRIPVKERPQPADYTITDDGDLYSFLELENYVKATADAMTAQYTAVKTVVDDAVANANAAVKEAQAAAAVANGIAGDASNAVATAQAANAAAAEAKAAAVAAMAVKLNITLPATGWTGDAAPYAQTVAVADILATDQPHYGVIYSTDLETRLAEKEAFGLVDDLDTFDGSVVFTCFEDVPAVDLNIQLEVNR